LKRIRFFGHDDNKDIGEEGFNGKMTEVHAALGLANLKYHQAVLADRKRKYLLYKNLLGDAPGLAFQKLGLGEPNYSYFPVIFKDEATLLRVEKALQNEAIFARRYFYPAVNTFHHILPSSRYEIAEEIAKRILCLPLYWQLPLDKLQAVTDCVIKAMQYECQGS
jgi:dTDP-4-amino-4,6-dideoxygalactose transaminase